MNTKTSSGGRSNVRRHGTQVRHRHHARRPDRGYHARGRRLHPDPQDQPRRDAADPTGLCDQEHGDFPAGSGALSIDPVKIQRELRRAAVGAIAGTGATDFSKLAEFYANNFDDLQKLFGHWRGKGGSGFGLAPVSTAAAPKVDPSRITGQGPAQQAAPGILDRIRNALAGYTPL